MGITVTIVAATVVGAEFFARYSENDWLPSGAHVADSTLGWVSLRYLLFDGNYPLIPWLAFPLVGMLFVRDGQVSTRPMKATLIAGLVCAAAAWAFTAWADGREVAPYLASTWVPTTVPFLLLSGGLSLAIIAGLVLWPVGSAWLAPVGRASLTHYLAHIALVFAPLRYFYPGEDWPLLTGLIATAGYLVAAVPLSIWWFRNHRRGPAEALLARLSGDHA